MIYPITIFAKDLLIFGDRNHNVFLGCITCDEYSSKSIFNSLSKFGFENSYGVWNSYGKYKSEYSSTSACNEYGSYPPVVVDTNGNFYGKFTLDEYDSKSVCYDKDNDLCKLVKILCVLD